MSSEYSFDIVSRVEKQSLADAVAQAQREIATRFDFRNSKSSIELGDKGITIIADDELKLKNVVDILQSKCVKRGVPLKALSYGDRAKRLTTAIKDSKLKVTARIQDEQVRVTGKSKDDLQKAIELVKGMPLDFAVQFVNYR